MPLSRLAFAGLVATMKYLRTLIPLLLFALLVLWLGSKMGAREPTYHPRTDNTLRRHAGGDPAYLNAILGVGRTSDWLMLYMNHFMVEWDLEKKEWVPKLCTGWDVSPDGRDYTFHLRTDVRWHDDEPFDADDVLFSFRTVMDPKVAAGHARADYLDSRFVATLPSASGENIEAEEYLHVRLDTLPVLSSAPAMDGQAEAAAATLAESASGSLRAALFGDSLYLTGTRLPLRDTSIFVAAEPGELTRYAPGAEVALWDGFLVADCGNLYPGPSGWYSPEGDVKSASFAVSEGRIEGIIPLRSLLQLGKSEPLPESLSLCLAWVDDVRLARLDAHTVRFHFPSKNYQNLANAGQLRLVAEHYYNDGQDFMKHARRDIPLGLGPYKFVRWKRETRIELERWENYWGKKPAIKRIQFTMIPDGVVAFQVFSRGDLDLYFASVWTYSFKCAGPEFDEHFRKVDYYRPGYGFVSYNCDRSFFSDKRCRQAMSHLIDIESALFHLQQGVNKPITGPHFWREAAYDQSLPLYEYNPEKAARLLDEAGWIDHDGDGIRDKDLNGDGVYSKEPLDELGNQREVFSFEVLWGGSALSVQDNWIPLSMERNCPKVGVECTIRTVGSSIQVDWLKEGNFDSASGSWVLDMDHDPTPYFHSSQVTDGFNYGRFNDPTTDRLLEAARQELDKDKRAEIFRRLHRRIWELQPCTFTYSHNWRWALNRRIKNVTAYDMDFDFLNWELEHDEED